MQPGVKHVMGMVNMIESPHSKIDISRPSNAALRRQVALYANDNQEICAGLRMKFALLGQGTLVELGTSYICREPTISDPRNKKPLRNGHT